MSEIKRSDQLVDLASKPTCYLQEQDPPEDHDIARYGCVCGWCYGALADAEQNAQAKIANLESQLATLTAERDAWKRQHDMILSQAQKDNLRAEDADRYEQWLLDLGRISGCGHVDENLPRCIEQAFENLSEENTALRAAAEAALKELRCLVDQATARGYTSGGPNRVITQLATALEQSR